MNDGLSPICKECKRDKARIYRESPKGKAAKQAWDHKEREYVIPEGATKTCGKCHVALPVAAFNKNNSGKYGVGATCKKCVITVAIEYRKTDQFKAMLKRHEATDTHKASVQRWNESEKGKESRFKHTHTDNFKKKQVEKAKIYAQTEKGKEAMDRYEHSPKGKARIARRNYARRVRNKPLVSTLTASEWLAIQDTYKHKCVYCGEKKPLTMDHIIPISKGGNHTKENIVPACHSCNARKYNKPVLLQLLVI
jgi:5-methylcytosine-specific restriction endonuclease McrA